MNETAPDKPTNAEMAKVIDLARYDITCLASTDGKRLVSHCRQSLARTGVCNLPGFVRQAAADSMAQDALSQLPSAYRDDSWHNVYFTAEQQGLAADHPGVRSQQLSTYTVPYDLIPSHGALRNLYNWPPMLAFVTAVLQRDSLYLHADPMGAMILFIHDDGDQLGWHFDHAEFVTTLILQAPLAGGSFEYVQNLRSPNDENIDDVKKVLAGDGQDVVRIPAQAGALSLFIGQNSIHRVTPTGGPQHRVVAVLSYESEPDVVFSDEERIRFYGRARLGT